jgi:hypothetical protein
LTTAGPTFSTISEKPSTKALGRAASEGVGNNKPFPQNPPASPRLIKRRMTTLKGAIHNGLAEPENIRDMCIIPISCFEENVIERRCTTSVLIFDSC